MTNYRLDQRRRTTPEGVTEWRCLGCGDWKPATAFTPRTDRPDVPRSRCRPCHVAEAKPYVLRPKGQRPAHIPAEAITAQDIAAHGIHAAAVRLPVSGYHCGRRAVVVVLCLDSTLEYGIWCAECDTVWRTGVAMGQNGVRSAREVSEAQLYRSARAWDDEAAFYREAV